MFSFYISFSSLETTQSISFWRMNVTYRDVERNVSVKENYYRCFKGFLQSPSFLIRFAQPKPNLKARCVLYELKGKLMSGLMTDAFMFHSIHFYPLVG